MKDKILCIVCLVSSVLESNIGTNFSSFLTATQPKYTDCQRRYMEQSRNPVQGRYLPWCRPDGGFNWRQCYGDHCFCVDQYGQQLSNTRVYSSNGLPKCSKEGKSNNFNTSQMGACHSILAQSPFNMKSVLCNHGSAVVC